MLRQRILPGVCFLAISCFIYFRVADCLAIEPLQVRYYFGGTAPEYAEKVLKLALSHSGETYNMIPVTTKMTTPRIIHTIQTNRADDIHLFWAASNPDLEKSLTAIPVPIERGLIGFRVLVIRRDTESRIQNIRDLPSLTTLRMLQGIGWSDTDILKKNGFRITEAAPENLYNMLRAGRADAFPRSVIDAPRELKIQSKQQADLTTAGELALIYPRFGVFFFVAKENTRLRKALETGLQNAIKNGSFRQLYENDPDIQSAQKMIADHKNILVLSVERRDSALNTIDASLFDPLLRPYYSLPAASNRHVNLP